MHCGEVVLTMQVRAVVLSSPVSVFSSERRQPASRLCASEGALKKTGKSIQDE